MSAGPPFSFVDLLEHYEPLSWTRATMRIPARNGLDRLLALGLRVAQAFPFSSLHFRPFTLIMWFCILRR